MLTCPMILTPFGVVTISPGRLPSTLPPASTARSTMTDPGASSATIASVSSTGALRPGMSAVQITTSVRFRASADLFALAALVILPHLAGIAFGGLRRTGGRFVDRDEAGAEALDLLLGGGANIGRRDDGAEAPRRGDRLQPGNPRPHHQHPRRLDRARRRSSSSGRRGRTRRRRRAPPCSRRGWPGRTERPSPARG